MGGNTAALVAGYAFFGVEHMLFASDYPYPGGAAQSDVALQNVIKSVVTMQINHQEKTQMFSGNARGLLQLS